MSSRRSRPFFPVRVELSRIPLKVPMIHPEIKSAITSATMPKLPIALVSGDLTRGVLPWIKARW